MTGIWHWMWKVVMASTHANSASLVTSEARGGDAITQPWIERREGKVKLPRKDKGQLCIWVMLIVTVFALTYVFCIQFIFPSFKLQLSMFSCFKSLLYFLFWKLHSYPLLIFLLVCFFSLIYRNSIIIKEISLPVYGSWTVFPVCHSFCLEGVYYWFGTTNKSIPDPFWDN